MRPGDRLAGGGIDFDKGLRADGAGNGEEMVAENRTVADDFHHQVGPAVAPSQLTQQTVFAPRSVKNTMILIPIGSSLARNRCSLARFAIRRAAAMASIPPAAAAEP